ncbi:hypothetical protein HOG16_03725 [Candidatus Woesearchaeota archaeon]|nr:hypothetical protein [Candidatus Woesearchaeota archaeon]MBT4321631.1 hypothetical protein [Candidatus Woesearchaeota archaeon]MBT4631058.1 hypothetical protein [Candidatus Woesearchaeota archaeon]
MSIILQSIHNLLLAIQGPANELVVMFPGTLLTFTLVSVMIRKKIVNFLWSFKK